MTTINTPDHAYEQNELNALDFCKCGVHKRFHISQFIKTQQELGEQLIMKTKNMQDVVAERVEEIMEQKPDCDCNDCRASFRMAITSTLTQLVKIV